jgi:hypothetical protein
MAELTRAASEAALQQRVDAAEAAFPPPHGGSSGKRLRNKGRQSRRVLTIAGSVRLARRWWHSATDGSLAATDQFIDPQLESVSPGVRELACRLNNDSTSFDRAAENLLRAALIKMSGKQLRQVVLAEGRSVLAAQQTNAIPPAFQAPDCRTQDGQTRIYTGCDGVMVPLITEAEKQRRRKNVCQKRQRCGKKRRPLAPREAWRRFALQGVQDHRVLRRNGEALSRSALSRQTADDRCSAAA